MRDCKRTHGSLPCQLARIQSSFAKMREWWTVPSVRTRRTVFAREMARKEGDEANDDRSTPQPRPPFSPAKPRLLVNRRCDSRRLC